MAFIQVKQPEKKQGGGGGLFGALKTLGGIATTVGGAVTGNPAAIAGGVGLTTAGIGELAGNSTVAKGGQALGAAGDIAGKVGAIDKGLQSNLETAATNNPEFQMAKLLDARKLLKQNPTLLQPEERVNFLSMLDSGLGRF